MLIALEFVPRRVPKRGAEEDVALVDGQVVGVYRRGDDYTECSRRGHVDLISTSPSLPPLGGAR